MRSVTLHRVYWWWLT